MIIAIKLAISTNTNSYNKDADADAKLLFLAGSGPLSPFTLAGALGLTVVEAQFIIIIISIIIHEQMNTLTNE